jgi:alcohol dehydrogenase YqhD (iron-dependent ADH family)
MENFTFCSPTKFVFGKGAENQCGALVKEFNGEKVLLHYGGGSVVKTGLLDRVKASLSAQGISFTELGGARPNPRDALVYKGIELCKKEAVDFVLAIGGGSSIDSAKAIALGVPYDGDFWDFYCGKAAPKKALPTACVLTIAAAGSEGSPNSVITKEDGMVKRGMGSELIRPVFSVLNPALTQTLPAFQTACGAVDIMAHVFERYITKTKDVECTDRLCEAVLLTIINETPKALDNPDDYNARANIMWAGTVAHNNLLGVGRQQDWNSHGIEHELSGLYDVAHGAGLAVIMPAWMTYVLEHDVMRFAQAAVRIWGCQMDFQNPKNTALAGIAAFKGFLKSIGMPLTFADLGAKEEDIPVLVNNHGVGDGKTGGFAELAKKDIENIYRLAL